MNSTHACRVIFILLAKPNHELWRKIMTICAMDIVDFYISSHIYTYVATPECNFTIQLCRGIATKNEVVRHFSHVNKFYYLPILVT